MACTCCELVNRPSVRIELEREFGLLERMLVGPLLTPPNFMSLEAAT
ncbi:hypothetical protein T4D_10575 [Trichinella pseudospiralis]|uniref:Uncharacterized protein n=1 Tax=Trichinella pseudospiralis TaxID=6337 RepID=A0A0V1FCF7_TRIPS|nr:hypothetical protein T4D_10575 [Trichinella pseudospiralis]